MSITFPSHLRRNRHSVLYFRLRIPDDLRQHFASREIYRSLRTASVRQATGDAQTLHTAFSRLFTELRQQSVSDKNKPPNGALNGSDWGLVHFEQDLGRFDTYRCMGWACNRDTDWNPHLRV